MSKQFRFNRFRLTSTAPAPTFGWWDKPSGGYDVRHKGTVTHFGCDDCHHTASGRCECICDALDHAKRLSGKATVKRRADGIVMSHGSQRLSEVMKEKAAILSDDEFGLEDVA